MGGAARWFQAPVGPAQAAAQLRAHQVRHIRRDYRGRRSPVASRQNDGVDVHATNRRCCQGEIAERRSFFSLASFLSHCAAQSGAGSTPKGRGAFKRTVYLSGNTLKSKDADGNLVEQPTETDDAAPTKDPAEKPPPWKQPEVGDVRVRWEMITPQTVSVLAMHDGDGGLAPWLGPNAGTVTAKHSQEAIYLLKSGSLDISGMIASAMERNSGEAWEQRLFGFGTLTMGSFLYCHFMEHSTDYADWMVFLMPGVGSQLAMLGPNTMSIYNALTIPLCTAVEAACLCLTCNLGWRLWYALRSLSGK